MYEFEKNICKPNGEFKCEQIPGTNNYIAYIEKGDGTFDIRVYDNNNKCIAKSVWTGEDMYNATFDRDNHIIKIEGNKVFVIPENNTENSYVPKGTSYVADSNSGKITALVVGGCVLAIAIGSTVLWFTKNPSVAAVVTEETVGVVGGAEAKKVLGAVFNKLATVLLPILLTNISKAEVVSCFNQAQNTDPIPVDPILVDLNGDGIKTTDTKNGIFFDHESDGFAEKSSWVDENDGVLAIDKNGDGIINNGNEIFGDSYIKQDGTKATNGFNALKDLDSNNDGVINSFDTEFQNIKILKGDGSLISLEEAGITSINLNSTSTNTVDENGNTIVSKGTFTKADGTIGNLGDYNLKVRRLGLDPTKPKCCA